MDALKTARTPVRVLITNNLNLAACLITCGLQFQKTEHTDTDARYFDYHLLDPDNTGDQLTKEYFERTLTLNVRAMFDARGMLVNTHGQLRQGERK